MLNIQVRIQNGSSAVEPMRSNTTVLAPYYVMLIECAAVGEMIKSTAEGRVERRRDLATNPCDPGGYATITSRAAAFAVTAFLMREPFLTELP